MSCIAKLLLLVVQNLSMFINSIKLSSCNLEVLGSKHISTLIATSKPVLKLLFKLHLPKLHYLIFNVIFGIFLCSCSVVHYLSLLFFFSSTKSALTYSENYSFLSCLYYCNIEVYIGKWGKISSSEAKDKREISKERN